MNNKFLNMAKHKIVTLPGDGIGVPQAFRAGRERVVGEVGQRREDEAGAVIGDKGLREGDLITLPPPQ